MEVTVVRHAIAEDRDIFAETGRPDDLRPLTAKGRKRMRSAARGLSVLVPDLDVLATSPATRCLETAKILSKAYGGIEPVEVEELSPAARPERILTWLQQQPPDSKVAIVGHEPTLSDLVSRLTADGEEAFLEFKKGGACMLRFDDQVDFGAGTLLWLLTPRQLRAIGG